MDFGFPYQTDFSDHGSSKKPKNPCTLEVDSSVPLTHHDPRDLGLIKTGTPSLEGRQRERAYNT